jgi:hypothetical protein
LQIKGGVQWVPIPEGRLGFSISTPTYLFALFERLTSNQSVAPPGPSTENPQGDLAVDFRLRSARFLFNQRTVPNGRFAVVFNATKFVKLGLGAFTDLSQTKELLAIDERQVDLFGGHFGLLFTNYDSRPDADELSTDDDEKTYVTVAIGFRYSHGRWVADASAGPRRPRSVGLRRMGDHWETLKKSFLRPSMSRIRRTLRFQGFLRAIFLSGRRPCPRGGPAPEPALWPKEKTMGYKVNVIVG